MEGENGARANRLWNGDPRDLVGYAHVLYKRRADPASAAELLTLRPPLMERALEIAAEPPPLTRESALALANDANTISTYLEWTSRQQGQSPQERQEALDLALTTAHYGLALATKWVGARHYARELLMLTLARIEISRGVYHEAQRHLNAAAVSAHHIRDARRRTHVYRKLGILYRARQQRFRGFCWGIRACFMRGIPGTVRLENIQALFSPDD